MNDLSQYAMDDPYSYERTLHDAVKEVLRDNRVYEIGYQPDYLYLAEYLHDIDPSLLEYESQFIIKIGQTADVRKRFGDPKLRKNFSLIAHVELPSDRHTRNLEKAVLNSIYRPVNRELVQHIRLPNPTDCMLVDVNEYNLIVDILNHFFDDHPFPRR